MSPGSADLFHCSKHMSCVFRTTGNMVSASRNRSPAISRVPTDCQGCVSSRREPQLSPFLETCPGRSWGHISGVGKLENCSPGAETASPSPGTRPECFGFPDSRVVPPGYLWCVWKEGKSGFPACRHMPLAISGVSLWKQGTLTFLASRDVPW